MTMKRILKGEAGQALPMALVLLVLGGLLVGTSVSLMHTNLKANIMVDRKTSELYAADAGVEEVLWNIQYKDGFTLPEDGDAPQLIVENLDLNEKTVNAYISKQADQPYKITSTASDDGNSTTIECYISSSLDFSWLFDNAITSPGTITLKNNTDVTGGIISPTKPDYPDRYDYWTQDDLANWPTAEEFSAFYWEQVKDLSPESNPWDIDVSSGTMDEPCPIGPSGSALAPGDLNISGGGVAKLNGTIYVKDNLVVKDSCTINLNGQTIYVEGNIELKNGCTFLGSGCIIAGGRIDFKTNGKTDPDGFIFLMSMTDDVILHNADSIYGCVAGNVDVELKNGCDLTLTDVPEDGLNFPSGGGGGSSSQLEILTYTIDPS